LVVFEDGPASLYLIFEECTLFAFPLYKQLHWEIGFSNC